MIYPTLTEAQRKRSQKFLIAFNLLNGLGYLCVGDSIMLFIFNKLQFPNIVVTVSQAMFNLGCLWIPLGKVATEHWGAARTQGNFWFLRNIAVIIMGSCVIWSVLGFFYIALAFLFVGSFIFYGCRAAGGVMSTALIGNITTPEERGKILAFTSMAHNIVAAVFTLLLAILLRYTESIWVRYGVVMLGACCGILSSICLWCIDESEEIRQAAKKPLIADAWACLKNDAFRRMVIAEVCFSMAMAVTTALNMVVLTRCFKISESLALGIGFVGSLLSVALARPASVIGDKFGPRKGMIIGYSFTFLIILFWQLVPGHLPLDVFHWDALFSKGKGIRWDVLWFYTREAVIGFGPIFLLFLLTSMCSMCCAICSGQYFLKCIPPEHQPSALTLKSLINGVLVGFLSLGITTLMWKFCNAQYGVNANTISYFRCFFWLGLPLVVLGFIGVWAQKEV